MTMEPIIQEEVKDKNFVEECDECIYDLKKTFELIHDTIMYDIETLVKSFPDDITEAPNTVSTSIIRIQSDLTKLRIKVNHEHKLLALYNNRMDVIGRRRKLEIKESIAGQPTGKMTLKEKVDSKYNAEVDIDAMDFVSIRHAFASSCLREIDETRELLRTISIQWHSADKRKRYDGKEE